MTSVSPRKRIIYCTKRNRDLKRCFLLNQTFYIAWRIDLWYFFVLQKSIKYTYVNSTLADFNFLEIITVNSYLYVNQHCFPMVYHQHFSQDTFLLYIRIYIHKKIFLKSDKCRFQIYCEIYQIHQVSHGYLIYGKCLPSYIILTFLCNVEKLPNFP